MSARCPVCAKADAAGVFVRTRPSDWARPPQYPALDTRRANSVFVRTSRTSLTACSSREHRHAVRRKVRHRADRRPTEQQARKPGEGSAVTRFEKVVYT